MQKKESISLPCTLRKCKTQSATDSTCHGSNNCYMWTLDYQQLMKKIDKLDRDNATTKPTASPAVCPRSRTICTDAHGSDNEFLLAADLAGSSASATDSPPLELRNSGTTKDSSRRSSLADLTDDK